MQHQISNLPATPAIPLSADSLAAQFHARGLSGRWLTAKQAALLLSPFRRETIARRGSAPAHEAGGAITGIGTWELHVTRTGGGTFTVHPYPTADEMAAQEAARIRAERHRALNDELLALLHAGKRDEMAALMEANRSWLEVSA